MKPNRRTRWNHQSKSDQGRYIRTTQPHQQHSSIDELEQDGFVLLDLPQEIISLILIRLPVKTVSILKCVSRYFSRFVSNKVFIREHLMFSTEDASMSGYRVMMQGDDDFVEVKQISIQSLCHISPLHFVNLDYPKDEPEHPVWLVGYCYGLVLIIVNDEYLFLWNPTIKKYKKLPNIVGHASLDIGTSKDPRFYCGLGFDVANVDYKVVALFAFGCRDSKSITDFRYEVNVYSSKKNSWTKISDFLVGEFDNVYGKFACGKLHWSTQKGDIISFDVQREVFGTLEHPSYEEGYQDLLLNVLSGSITVGCAYNTRIDVWVMKEYGLKDSWTKMFTLSDYDLDFNPSPCSIMPNGEVLTVNGVFGFYNIKDRSWHSTTILFDYDPIIYVESLVSPVAIED